MNQEIRDRGMKDALFITAANPERRQDEPEKSAADDAGERLFSKGRWDSPALTKPPPLTALACPSERLPSCVHSPWI